MHSEFTRTPAAASARVRRLACLVVATALAVGGCAPQGVPPLVLNEGPIPPDAFIVPGNRDWVDTGVDVTRGEAVSIVAQGRLRVTRLLQAKDDSQKEVGPEGTFFYSDDLLHQDFPLPAAGRGPAACFSLIGRIGQGPPFFVGGQKSWVAEQSGRLFLGINDFDPSANEGEFYAQVLKPEEVQPATYRQEVPLELTGGGPAANCSVVVFYLDGLRPDVVEEMSAMGHLPHLTRHFVEGGTHLVHAFTAFPSDTITSNGTMWTGCFSDRHGLKGQVRFHRGSLKSDSFLDPLGPNRSSRQLGPQGLDKVVHHTEAAAVQLVQGRDAADEWRRTQTSAVPALYDFMRARGQDWATGILPVMTDVPPILWTRSLTRHLPYFQIQNAWQYIDDANAHYALRHLLRQYRPVTVIWMPETDSVSHKECRGQFGSTRRTIARADKLVGEVVAELQAQGRLDSTYLILVSDHGHEGGATTHLSRFDLANELFYASRQVTHAGRWVGGGLGLSVCQHRYANWHKGDTGRQFAFIDGDSDGAARIFLPRGHYRSGEWLGANRPADLLAYRLAPHLEPINLPATLAHATAINDAGAEEHPIDLVLMKTGENSIVISTCDRGEALIERQRDSTGRWLYRYTPVMNIAPSADGGIVYQPALQPRTDPLGLVRRTRRAFLQQYHDEQTWLGVTAGSEYPDGVVTLTRHMLWQENLRAQEPEYAADLVVTARHGWLFGTQNTPGTTHGYPLADAVRATFYVSGPNVRRAARVQAPCRLVDLTPTILELTGTNFDPAQFDGRALHMIYETSPADSAVQTAEERRPRSGGGERHSGARDVALVSGAAGSARRPRPPRSRGAATALPNRPLVRAAGASDGMSDQERLVAGYEDDEPQAEVRERPMYWKDFDLEAWRPLAYTPGPVFDHMPLSINHPTSGWDVNNITYNALAIGDWSVFRLVDDLVSPLTPGRTRVVQTVEKVETRAGHHRRAWIGDGVQALNVPGVSLSDYSVTSAGNLRRADRAVDWLQERGTRLDDKLATRTGHRTVLGAPAANTVIDTVQGSAWEVYRFAQRIIAELLDEVVLNGVENGVDATLNSLRSTPAEIVVEGP